MPIRGSELNADQGLSGLPGLYAANKGSPDWTDTVLRRKRQHLECRQQQYSAVNWFSTLRQVGMNRERRIRSSAPITRADRRAPRIRRVAQ